MAARYRCRPPQCGEVDREQQNRRGGRFRSPNRRWACARKAFPVDTAESRERKAAQPAGATQRTAAAAWFRSQPQAEVRLAAIGRQDGGPIRLQNAPLLLRSKAI